MTFSLTPPITTEVLLKDGQPVARLDRHYATDGDYVAFDELVLVGNCEGTLEYNGKRLTLLHASEQIGMLVDMKGSRGPVLRGVLAKVEKAG